jgi:3-isopropylmalate/(R)-2-methylmalate dehydratase small subunit
MLKEITAKAFVYGKNIDTDQIYPGRYLELVKPEDIAKHCMEGVDPTFRERMTAGDIIVAAINLALPLMVCPGISEKVKEGDVLDVNLVNGAVLNKTTGTIIKGQKLSEYTMNILENGGIKTLFKKRLRK